MVGRNSWKGLILNNVFAIFNDEFSIENTIVIMKVVKVSSSVSKTIFEDFLEHETFSSSMGYWILSPDFFKSS